MPRNNKRKLLMSSKTKSLILVALSVFILAILGIGLYIWNIKSTSFDINETVYILIDEQKDYDIIKEQLKDIAHVENLGNFEKVAGFLEYPANIKSGRYAISPSMNVVQAVRLLKSGKQIPVKIRFNNNRTKEDLIERLTDQLMIKSEELSTLLNNEDLCQKYGFDTNTIVCMFIPNTYEVYWNISADKLLDRMNSEYKKFWNDDRLAKAELLNMSPTEVSILASIVEEECYFTDEYPIVAGLYINRLKKEMLLQADPTVKYAVGDFTLRRILNKHLETDSPYNTYKYNGLPPGPIRIPSISGINSVLNYRSHNYLFMCAKEDFSGKHNFAVTHAEHQRNAARYQAELNKRKIYN